MRERLRNHHVINVVWRGLFVSTPTRYNDGVRCVTVLMRNVDALLQVCTLKGQ